jgi:hypothetical protein
MVFASDAAVDGGPEFSYPHREIGKHCVVKAIWGLGV